MAVDFVKLIEDFSNFTGRSTVASISIFAAVLCLCIRTVTLHQSLAYESITSLPLTTGTDKITWRLSSSGQFTVKSLYKVLSQGGRTVSTVSPIWKAKVTPSMTLFFYFLIHNRLLTQDVMQRRHFGFTVGCVMCAQRPLETAMHLFFQCPFVVPIWEALSTALGYTVLQIQETLLLTYLASAPASQQRTRTWMANFITATVLIWRERNNRIFRNKSTTTAILTSDILHEATLYLKLC